MVSALLHAVEIAGGRIVVDGLDIARAPREQLRSSIICLPQDPYVFEDSSVRDNVDPFSHHPSEVVVSALAKVGLWDLVEARGGIEITVGPDLFSDGQQQLLCLARAMLRDGKIVVFDEVTSR